MSSCFQNGVAANLHDCLGCFLKSAINFGFGIAAVVAVAFVMIAGIRYVTSNGDQVRIAKARSTITFALIGLAVVVLSFSLVNFSAKMFGVKFFDLCPG